MKYLLLTLLGFGFTACEDKAMEGENLDAVAFVQAESFQDFTCVYQQADNPPAIADARKWIVGKWQLKGIISMVPNMEVPNIKVEFLADGGVFVTNAGKTVFTNAYSINDVTENNYSYINITTDATVITDGLGQDSSGDNFLKGTIRICENELMIDNGIAFDAPGYLFRKI
ncbi:MAG: hypothetical protein ACI9IP_001974 [Arcticibacterium sp.]|jgi:hypothetical protein